MRRYIRRMREYMERSLKRQLAYYLIACALVPLTIVTSVLFVMAREEMINQAVLNIKQRSQAVAAQVDELLYNVKGVSDVFANDEEILRGMEKDYTEKPLEKLKDIHWLNSYFGNLDPFQKNEHISALYTKKREILNLHDPGYEDDVVENRMLELGAEEKSNLSIFKWYPLEENFLSSKRSGDVRTDKVIIGTRRILNSFTGNWLYTQFFAIPEEKIFNLYQNSAKEMGGSVYIVDKKDCLISSSDENTVKTGQVPQNLIALARDTKYGDARVEYEGAMYILDMEELGNARWSVITLVPVSAATSTVDKLFKEIIVVMFLGILLCAVLITWISNRFLQPVEVLDASMKEVYNGNLKAYVQTDEYNGEIKSMMTYYNAMLVQINRYINEMVESEKKKKELELEVLMGQVNPHFLYNTLENIVWKSNEVGCPDIGRIAASLGRLYRLSIGNGETIVSIQQEVEHVMAYVNIQKNRYKEKMEFELRVNYEEIRGYSMIKLTLQPVVENCFMYAMEDIDRVLNIRLTIRVRREVVEFCITDNGRGIQTEQLEDVRRQIDEGKPRALDENRKKNKGTGIGLYSVKERIAIYTGYSDGLQIRSKPGIGTFVKITIPKIPSKDKNEQ